MAFVSQGSRGLPAEVDNFAVLGTGGRWAAAQIPTTAISGAPTTNNRKSLRGSGAWSSEPASIMTIGRGLLLETFDIAQCTGATTTTAGRLQATGFGVPAGTPVANIAFAVAAGTAVATHCWALLYDSAFTLLAQSADTPLAVNLTNAFGSLALTAPVTPAADAYCYAGILCVGAAPTLMNATTTNTMTNTAFSTGAPRAINQTGLTAPSNPAVPGTAISNTFWFGIF